MFYVFYEMSALPPSQLTQRSFQNPYVFAVPHYVQGQVPKRLVRSPSTVSAIRQRESNMMEYGEPDPHGSEMASIMSQLPSELNRKILDQVQRESAAVATNAAHGQAVYANQQKINQMNAQIAALQAALQQLQQPPAPM